MGLNVGGPSSLPVGDGGEPALDEVFGSAAMVLRFLLRRFGVQQL